MLDAQRALRFALGVPSAVAAFVSPQMENTLPTAELTTPIRSPHANSAQRPRHRAAAVKAAQRRGGEGGNEGCARTPAPGRR